jgi:copper homeostasis protein
MSEKQKVLLEIACFNPQSAITAYEAGADRIEICEDLFTGGITPSDKTIDHIINNTGAMQRFVMIHKQGSKYQYTTRDFQWMLDRIGDLNFKDVHGYVFGAVNEKNMPDIPKLAELIIAAEGKPCTFHRAFDSMENKEEALEQLIKLGFHRVLTSGGDGNAVHNIAQLAALNKQAAGRIIILAGGGVRSANAAEIISKTGVKEIHSSAILRGESADAGEIRKLKEAGA